MTKSKLSSDTVNDINCYGERLPLDISTFPQWAENGSVYIDPPYSSRWTLRKSYWTSPILETGWEWYFHASLPRVDLSVRSHNIPRRPIGSSEVKIPVRHIVIETPPSPPDVDPAHFFLESAVTTMKERAKQRDAGDGERSMAKTVDMFNAATGLKITEEQGWLFMVCLKVIRGMQGGYHADDYVDGAAYFGLMGEAACKSRKK